MNSNLDKNKRIAKNTLMLYIRMLFLMLVNLYTSRVVLQALGIEDYGVYNAVAGFIALFSMVSNSISGAISRFLTFVLGLGDQMKLNKVFSTALIIQITIALIVVALVEIVGVWFLNTHMTIPDNRIFAANCVLQLTLLTFVFNLWSTPYNAAIIAHEKMSAFAYIGIFDGCAKLSVAFLIWVSPIDNLIFYTLLMSLIALATRILYTLYCKHNFDECHFKCVLDKGLFKEMFGFAGWNFIGASSAVLRDQGGNIIINLFCGPTVNAARGIALQVNGAVSGFASNFMTALNPQITKSYASGDHEYLMKLIFQGSRLSFYMLLFFSVPIWASTHYILVLWLKLVPAHSVFFIQLILLYTMLEALSTPLITAMLATGKIRNYQIIVGGTQMLNLPLSYLFLRFGAEPETVLIVAIFISQVCLAERLILLRRMINLPSVDFLKKVYLNVMVVMAMSCFFPILLSYYLEESFLSFVIISLVSVFTTGLVIFYIGCSDNEIQFAKEKIKNLKYKMLKR